MRASLATAPARPYEASPDAANPDAANEDFAAVAPSAAVLLDGAGIPAGLESGCVHGVAWFARTLGTAVLALICDPASGSLAGCLHDAITQVRSRHRGVCDLSHPGSPTATVVAIRERGSRLEYLVLADSSLVLTGIGGESQVLSDRRNDEACGSLRALVERVPADDPARPAAFRDYVEAARRLKNVPGGFWVASADPDVAGQALTGSRPLAGLQAALLLSDGASRLADLFGLAPFASLAALVSRGGPAGIIRQVRAAEAGDPRCLRWPRSKVYDDATVVHCDRFGE